jgi:hypothetical protein
VIHDRLWKKIYGKLDAIKRTAVRVIFIGPGADVDDRIRRVKEKENVRPMNPEFFSSIKDFLDLAAEKNRQWTSVIKPKADQLMSDVWSKLWKTQDGRAYQELKAEVDRRKSQVDAVAKRAEDGVAQKILTGGRVVTFIKTHVIVGREDMLTEAKAEVDRLRQELVEAKKRLVQLEKGEEDATERLNLIVVEELKNPAKPKVTRRDGWWARRSGVEQVQAVILNIIEIDTLIADELTAIDGLAESFLATLENIAQQEMHEEDLQQLMPEEQEQPAEIL